MNDKIRNFSIIAHIDHGKSTLADRILELTGSLTKRDIRAQILDSMDIERERGITIKLNAVHLKYKDYILQLIDTPGHVDFTYEVSRSLAACEGAILVIDSTQGVEAQTISNVYLALENNLEIIPVINKIDLPNSDVEKVKKQVEEVIGIDCSDAPLISAKTGLNVEKVLDAIIEKVPSPKLSKPNAPLKALIFDSYFDEYRGVVLFVRIKQGKVRVGDKIKLFSTGAAYTVADLGINTPKSEKLNELKNGWVGWIACSIKNIKDVHVGDTLYRIDQPITHPLPGYKKKTPMVYAGLFPIDNNKYEDLKVALEKMALSDASLIYDMETSQALGHGFRCGFLGLLHMDVIRERIEREYNIDLIATAPSVKFKVNLTSKEQIEIISPSDLPDKTKIISIEEPYVKMKTMLPEQYIGVVMDLCHKKRGIYKDLIHIDSTMRELVYEIPLGEIIWNFFDSIKSVSKGYATLDYEPIGYRVAKLVKMDILVAGKAIDALSSIIHSDNAYYLGRELTKLLKKEIPRHQFEVPLQAAIGNKVIARETVKSYRKDVIAKCYGGDITRKKKLLSKQKAGKKRMKTVGAVEIPQSAFISVLKISN